VDATSFTSKQKQQRVEVKVKTEAKSTSKVAGQHELGPSITPLGLQLEVKSIYFLFL
jgi:ATP-dependent RNA helicase DDX55/SPB4